MSYGSIGGPFVRKIADLADFVCAHFFSSPFSIVYFSSKKWACGAFPILRPLFALTNCDKTPPYLDMINSKNQEKLENMGKKLSDNYGPSALPLPPAIVEKWTTWYFVATYIEKPTEYDYDMVYVVCTSTAVV